VTATERIVREKRFHDQQAADRAITYRRRPEALVFANDDYLNHAMWIRPAFQQLGELHGVKVLDFGCGHGMAAVVMARLGAQVTAFDLSGGYVQEARWRAQANEANIEFLQANGEMLPFADGSFDRIWGNAMLHHLDLQTAARELKRVLRPGGWIVFCEPWGGNRLLNWARTHVAYAGKQRTIDENPLQDKQIRILESVFSHIEIQGFQILGMARRFLKSERIAAILDYCDAKLLLMFPGLMRFCRYIVITLRH
jgi:2-polyprenyl-3-methyl-5-hydroxy-6-metoxy-1,4-benzoquinol methylase